MFVLRVRKCVSVSGAANFDRGQWVMSVGLVGKIGSQPPLDCDTQTFSSAVADAYAVRLAPSTRSAFLRKKRPTARRGEHMRANERGRGARATSRGALVLSDAGVLRYATWITVVSAGVRVHTSGHSGPAQTQTCSTRFARSARNVERCANSLKYGSLKLIAVFSGSTKRSSSFASGAAAIPPAPRIYI